MKTGTQRWRAVLANKDHVLMPGLFVRVRLAVSEPHKALLVPETSLGSDQGQKFLFVVGDQNVADCRDVQTGQRQDDGLVAIDKGLADGDWVVISGFRQFRPGMTVTPEKTAIPSKP